MFSLLLGHLHGCSITRKSHMGQNELYKVADHATSHMQVPDEDLLPKPLSMGQ